MLRRVMPIFLGAMVLAVTFLVLGIGVSGADETSKLVKVRDECTESFNIFFGDPTMKLR